MVDPIGRLRADRAAALAADDPNAKLCVLATVDQGEPHARVLVLRDLDGELGVFLNAASPKRRQLRQSNAVAVVVYLPSLAVQYRLRCALRPIPPAVVRASWQLRPDAAKRLDWLYDSHPQGSPVESRERLFDLLAGPVPDRAPDAAAGFHLAIDEVERLRLGTPDGVHDRRRYVRSAEGWREEVLVP